MGKVLIIKGADFSAVAVSNIEPGPGVNPVLTLRVSPDNSGVVSGGGSYPKGTSVDISATPNSGYRFKQWSDSNTQPSRTVVLSSSLTLTAQFEVKTETVYYFDNILGNESTLTETDNSYFPIHLPSDASYIGKSIEVVKILVERAGSVTFAVYNASSHSLVSTIGTFDLVAGINEITLPTPVTIQSGNAFGISAATAGIKFRDNPIPDTLTGAFAQADFGGTLGLALGY